MTPEEKKAAKKLYDQKYNESNKEKKRLAKKEYYSENKEVLSQKNKERYRKSVDSVKERQKKWRESNKDYSKKYYQANPDKFKAYGKSDKTKTYNELNKDKRREISKIWAKNNPDKVKSYYKDTKSDRNKYQRETYKKRVQSDPLFKMTINIKSSIRSGIKKRKFRKTSKTLEILGCSFEFLKAHLESNFKPWMNWDNYGSYDGTLNYGWDIDHIIPLCTAKNKEELIKLNHYSNLQPLCSYTNRNVKKGKIL